MIPTGECDLNCEREFGHTIMNLLYDDTILKSWLGTGCLAILMAPTLIYLTVEILIICSRMFAPFLKPLTLRLLNAFYESNKGILAQIGIAISIISSALLGIGYMITGK
jgi:hypothetical protein